MTTEDAFLQAIIANPADDTVRLVYCDFLDERGGPGDRERAEFIRVQCEIAKAGIDPSSTRGCCDHGTLNDRCLAHKLVDKTAGIIGLLQHQFAAAHPIDRDKDWERGYQRQPWPIWKRGFIADVECPLSWWLRHGPRVVRRHPVERVVLTDRVPDGRAGVWTWWGTEAPGGLDHLHPELFRLLRSDTTSPNARHYGTRDEAISALSAALILWAKSQPHPARLTTSPVSADLTT